MNSPLNWSNILAASLIAMATSALATQTDTYGLHAVPVKKPIVIDGTLGDWDLSGEALMCYDVESLRDVYSAKVAVMYDAEHLYIAVQWKDSTPLGNSHDPRYEAHKAWAGDCLQLRLKTDRISHVTAWYFGPEKAPGFHLDHGKDLNNPFGGGAETLHQTEGWKLEKGVETAYRADADGKGYVQEIKIPWSLIADRKYSAGEKFQMGVELLWGQGDWPSHRYADNVSEGSSGREFFFTNHKGWGDVLLEAHGDLKLAAPAWEKAQAEEPLNGPVEIRYALPKAGKVSLAIDDSAGHRVRHLLSAQPRKAGGNVEKWDGLDDGGKPVLPGEYTFKAITHDGFHLKYALSFANPGNPSWQTDDGRGGFYGDHTAPQAVAAAGSFVALATPMGEAGKHLIGLDQEGQRLWGLNNRVAFDGGRISLASDGSTLWVANEGKQSLIYRVAVANGRYAPWESPQKDKEGRVFNPVDLVVSELPGMMANPKEKTAPNLCAVAVKKDALAAAFAREDCVRLYHPATGALLSSVQVQSPRAVAFTRDGTLLVLSEGRVMRVDAHGKVQPFADRAFAEAWGMAVGADGSVYVSVRGIEQNVKVFNQTGALVREIGKRGGRPHHGRFEAGAMRQPAGLSVDRLNRLWVAEETSNPKRTSVWDAATGALLRDLSGTTSYAGAGTVNPFDPSMGFADDTVYRIDWVTGKSEPVYSLGAGTESEALFAPSVHNLTSRVLKRDRRLHVYTTGSARGSGEVQCTQWDGKDWRSSAHVGTVVQGKGAQGPLAKYQHPFFNGHDKQVYSWADENGDGLVQEEELQFSNLELEGKPVALRSYYWGQLPDEDGTITYMVSGRQELVQFKISGFTRSGAPKYDVSKPRFITPDRALIGGGNGEGQIIGGTNGRFYINQNPLVMIESSGRVVGAYPNPHTSVHGSHSAKAARPGYLIGPSSFLGVAQVGDERSGAAGEIFCLNGNLGENYLFTHDGLFIQSIFKDCRGYSETPAHAERGMPMDATTAGGESFGGNFVRTVEGKTYLTNGATDARVIEVTDLESIRRFDGSFTYTPTQFAQAQALLSERLLETAAPKVFTVPKGSAVVNGKVDDWPDLLNQEKPAIEVQESSKLRYARVLARYDAQNLYLAYRVFASRSAMKNQGQDDRLLFKTGDAVDVMLGVEGDKESTGNLRLLMTFKDGKTPIAVLNVKKSSNGLPSEKFEFSSPWRTVRFDRVVTLPGVSLASGAVQGGYLVEASIPWIELGITPKSGLRLKADIGVLFGDGGTQTVSRQYWSNKATGLVNDVPGEADLEPKAWGTFILE